jgi:quercetin dioxygenase-like cupin family protein
MKNFILTLALILISIVARCQYSQGVIIEPLLKTDTTSIGQKIHYPVFESDEVSIMKVTIPPGKSTGWHKHSFPVFAFVMKGTLTVELVGEEARTFKENSTFAEVIDTPHNGKNIGEDTVVLIAFFMGEKGKSLSEHIDVNGAK